MELQVKSKWYVSLGDGTFVEMDERPYVFLATDEQVEHMDRDHEGKAPIDCATADGKAFEAHIHIEQLFSEKSPDDSPPTLHVVN